MSAFDVVPLDLLDHSRMGSDFYCLGCFLSVNSGRRETGGVVLLALLLSEHAEPQWMILEMNLLTR
jgi:hypothetical protein